MRSIDLEVHDVADPGKAASVVGIAAGQNKTSGRSIILNGHIDVVSPGPLEHWTKAPWSAEESGGRVYGRGACDMKAGLAGMLMALTSLKRSGVRLLGDVILESVVEEEIGGAGTRACARAGFKADGAIIGEPTELGICPMSRGSAWFSISVRGQEAHSAVAWRGVSALEQALPILDCLRQLKAQRSERLRELNPVFKDCPDPFPLFIGMLKCGTAPNTLPGFCELYGILGVAPSETIPDARREMEAALTTCAGNKKCPQPVLSWLPTHFEPAGIPATHRLVGACASACEAAGRKARVEGFPSGCDQGLLIQEANTPTVVFGPGSLVHAHSHDEHVACSEYLEYVKILAMLLVEWCGAA
jgi:acetylornithine deacetylase